MRRLKISSVHDLRFGRHINRSFTGFDADLVVVYGPNESGKSTLAEFLTWAIGGPWRTAGENSEVFRIGSDGIVGGRFVGTLGTDVIDLRADFKILEKGAPNDLRAGHVGGTKVESKKQKGALEAYIGDIAPRNFELHYRLYGASLGDLGSGTAFEDLFSKFSVGGTQGVLNPREVLKGLRRAYEVAGSAKNAADGKLETIGREIEKARTSPDLVEDLLKESSDIQQRIEELSKQFDHFEKRRLLLTRVINGARHWTNLADAQARLANLPAVSSAWLSLVEHYATIENLASRIAEESRTVDNARRALTIAAASVGMDPTRLEGTSLNALERLQITSATSDFLTTRDELAKARTERREVGSQHDILENSVANLARTIGMNDDDLVRLDSIESHLPDIKNRAELWREAHDRVIVAQSNVERSVTHREEAKGSSSLQSSSRLLNPKLMALAVLLVAGVSVVHWGAAIVAGIAVAAFVVFGRTQKSTSISIAEPDDKAVEDSKAQAAGFQHAAQEHSRLLVSSLTSLASYVTTADLAPGQIGQFIELASRRRAMREISDRIAVLDRQIVDLEPVVLEGERVVATLLEPRGIDLELVNRDFATWFAKYESAVVASVEATSAKSSLEDAERRFNALTSPVAVECVGLNPQAFVSRLNDVRAAAFEVHRAEIAFREAEIQIRAAELDTPEILALRDECPDVDDQKNQLKSVVDSIAHIDDERERLNNRRVEIGFVVKSMEETEVLPGLMLQKGTIEDELEESKTSCLVLGKAVELLAEAIDEHERDNQEPAVARASELVAEVVPDWGTIIATWVKKNEKDREKLQFQRDGADGRFDDHAISDGGRALLYLGVRLAFAEMYAEEKEIALPLICDDPLIHFDDDRKESALRLLKNLSSRHQVVLFTCEGATRDLAVSMGAKVIEM